MEFIQWTCLLFKTLHARLLWHSTAASHSQAWVWWLHSTLDLRRHDVMRYCLSHNSQNFAIVDHILYTYFVEKSRVAATYNPTKNASWKLPKGLGWPYEFLIIKKWIRISKIILCPVSCLVRMPDDLYTKDKSIFFNLNLVLKLNALSLLVVPM